MDPNFTEEITIDEDDPIYDVAEDSSKYILTSIDVDTDKRGYDPGTSKAVYGPMLTRSEFKIQFAECIKEYFDSCDADEVIRTLEELGCMEYHAEIVKKVISLSLDKGPRERELTSRLLTCLHPTPLSMDDLTAGFTLLLDSLDDLCTDVPEAKVRFKPLFVVVMSTLRLTISLLSPWQPLFWLEPLWMKFCLLPF
jgi:programmed cell death protein 4